MTIDQVTRNIEKTIPLQEAEDFDNVGLLCGDPQREVSGILICHDVLETVVDEALAKNCNLIVSFHPIIFSGLKSITGKNYVERVVLKAIENKIAIYAIHTALDNNFFGVNQRICTQLGLSNLEILMPKKGALTQLTFYVPAENSAQIKNALFEAGAGQIGFYNECSFTLSGKGTFRPVEGANPYSGIVGERENAVEDMISVIFESYKTSRILSVLLQNHPYEEVAYQLYSLQNQNQYSGLGMCGTLENEMSEEEFLDFVKSKFNLQVIRHSNFISKPIKKVGVLGGSGAGGIKAALGRGCDAYLSGDFKYHDFYQAEGEMLLCDLGHFESEQFVTQQLHEILSEKFTTFAVLKSTVNTNPVNYFL